MCTSIKKKEQSTCQNMIQLTKKLCIEIIYCLIVQVHSIIDSLLDFLFGFIYNHKKSTIPPIENPILFESVTSLAKLIRTKEITSEEVVESYINRCKEVNELINAIVADRYDDAIQEAKDVDKFIENCTDIDSLKQTKPLLGIPFTTKESNRVKDLPHSLGLLSRQNYRSPVDATVIDYVKNAGGILIAVTNVPEINLWIETRNNLYGQTNNPYNTTRTVGGSSGGEGAIVSACGTAFSVASDIGGSTRMPAFFNGVFGFKPSEGLTIKKGIGFREKDYPHSMAEVGPICKNGDDLALLLKIFIGNNISKVKLDEFVDIKQLNVFFQEGSGDLRASKVNKSLRNILRKAVHHLQDLTGPATKIKIPGSEYSYRLWRYWMSQEDADFKFDITNQKYRTSAKAELYKLITGKSELTLPAIMKLIDEDFLPKDSDEWAKTITNNMKEYLLEKLGDNGVLLYPSSPFPAPYHYSSFFRPFNFGYWCLFNVLKFPACQVPLGLDPEGLPVGIQVVAAPYNDHLCIAIARELEKASGGWVTPGLRIPSV